MTDERRSGEERRSNFRSALLARNDSLLQELDRLLAQFNSLPQAEWRGKLEKIVKQYKQQ